MLHALVVVLLQLQVSAHVLHLAVPVVELVSLHRVDLLARLDGLLHFRELLFILFQILFQQSDAVLEDFLVRVESRLQFVEFLRVGGCLVAGLLELGLVTTDLDLYTFFLKLEVSFSSLLLELLLLVIFQLVNKVFKVFSQGGVLEGELIYFLSEHLDLRDSGLVARVQVEFGLDTVVLLVQEIDLGV